MKHYFIINPAAGKTDRTDELSLKIAQVCKDLDFEVLVSREPKQCEVLAANAVQTDAPCRIYACGGDGTLNEVVNGVAGHPNAAVTHFPIGSGNDFIKNSSDPDAFFKLENLLDPEEREFDLIEVNDRFCLDIASIGIDARIGTELANYKRLPLISGAAAYKLSTAVNVVKGIHRHYVIEIDGQTIDDRKTLICVCNGRWYGGGFFPVPEASLDDGILDVLVVNAVSRFHAASLIGKYKEGRYREISDHIQHYRVSSLAVHCDTLSRVNIDGELLWAKDVRFRVSQQKIRFFYPKGLSWEPKASAVTAI